MQDHCSVSFSLVPVFTRSDATMGMHAAGVVLKSHHHVGTEQVEVPKDNRHRDRPIVQDIYAALDAHLAAHQSRLSY